MLTRPLFVKHVLAGVLSVAVVLLVPHTVASGGDVPPAGMLLVTATIAPVAQTALFTAFLSAPFFLSFVSLTTRPGEAVIGYKG